VSLLVVLPLLFVTKSSLVAQFLQARARWRLDSAGASASHAARSVVSLLDAAGYLRDVPDDDPDIVTLDAAGCFRGEAFDPGPEGAFLVRRWQLADVASAGPRELLTALAQAALKTAPAAGPTPIAKATPAARPAPIPGPAPKPAPAPTKRAPSRR
jgi:hypothetical protein